MILVSLNKPVDETLMILFHFPQMNQLTLPHMVLLLARLYESTES